MAELILQKGAEENYVVRQSKLVLCGDRNGAPPGTSCEIIFETRMVFIF